MTGLATVDQQHRHLVGLINQFDNLLMQPEGADADAIEQLFAELKDYAQYHFQDEEGLMERSAMDPRHMAQHRTEHAMRVSLAADEGVYIAKRKGRNCVATIQPC